MKTVLGRKQSIDNEKWIEVMKNIEEYVSKEEVELISCVTIDAIKKTIKDKKVAYAWSGGKDSLVLESLCNRAGIKNCVLGICNLEYPAFFNWIINNKPKNLEVINTGQDLDWLSKHPNMLFPKGNFASQWFSIVQHKAQREYYKKHNLDMLILGRRKADGNYVGKNGIYTDSKNITRYSPLADWSHEMILAYIHYNNIEMPLIYSWENGYKCGTHPWPARQYTKNIMQGWKEIYEIDKSIVEEAAKKIESAKIYLEGIKNGNHKS